MVHRYGKADEKKKRRTHALETARFQAELLKSLETSGADPLIDEAIRGVESGAIQEMFRMYRSGDAGGLEAFLAASRDTSPGRRRCTRR